MAKKELMCKHCLRGTFNKDEECDLCKSLLGRNPQMRPPVEEDDDAPAESK